VTLMKIRDFRTTVLRSMVDILISIIIRYFYKDNVFRLQSSTISPVTTAMPAIETKTFRNIRGWFFANETL